MNKKAFRFFSFCLYFLSNFSVGTQCDNFEISQKIHNVISSHHIPLAPLLFQKCSLDLGKNIFDSFYKDEQKPWQLFAFHLYADYFLDVQCQHQRNHLVDRIENVSWKNTFLKIPIGLTLFSYGANKCIDLFNLNPSYCWFFLTQLWSACLFANNLKQQMGDLATCIQCTEARHHVVNTLFRIGSKYSPLTARIAQFFYLDRILGGEACDEPLPAQSEPQRLTSLSALHLISGLLFWLGGKTVSAFSHKDNPWKNIIGDLLALYGKDEIFKILSAAKGENQSKQFSFLSACSLPLLIISGVKFAKNICDMTHTNETVTQTLIQSLGFLALWWNSASFYKNDLEQKIVGFDVTKIRSLCLLLCQVFPSFPDIGSILNDLQNLALSIVYK